MATPPDTLVPGQASGQPATSDAGRSTRPTADGAAQTPPSAAGRPFDDEWRRWLSENLHVGASPQSVIDVLVANGFSRDAAGHEIERAQQSPYFRGAQLLRNRLRKREWILACYRLINRLDPRTHQVERRHRLSREDFLQEYYSTNRPVIITGMMDDWPAMRKWNLDYFSERFGDREVDVQMNRNAGPNYEINSEHYARRVRFGEFVRMVREAGETNDFYLTANNNSRNRDVLHELWDDIIEFPEYLRNDMPGHRFFWLGPAGTVTPFHHDLTNNFMAQVIGRKLVKIAPSWDMPLMRNHVHVFCSVDGRVTPADPEPAFERPQILECVLHAGEILFLPIGCLHFVQGLDISVTVSFTNFVFDNEFRRFYDCNCPL
jgi:Cupin-like domain